MLGWLGVVGLSLDRTFTGSNKFQVYLTFSSVEEAEYIVKV